MAVWFALIVFHAIAWLELAAAAGNETPFVEISARTIDAGPLQLEGVRLDLAGDGSYRITLDQASHGADGRRLEDISLQGIVTAVNFGEGLSRFETRAEFEGVAVDITLVGGSGQFSATLEAAGLDLPLLRAWMPSLPGIDWIKRAGADIRVRYEQVDDGPPDWSARLALHDLAFDSPDGQYAGEALRADLAATLDPEDPFRVALEGEVRGGEVLIGDFYRDFSDGGLSFFLDPHWRNGVLDVPNVRFSDGHSLQAEGSVRYSETGPSVRVNQLELRFPGAYERYLESAAAAWTLDGLEVTGRLSWSGKWLGEVFESGDLLLQDLTMVDGRRNRFAVTGLDARLRPGDAEYVSSLAWRGLLLGRINLGPGATELDPEPGVIGIIRPLRLDLLGGSLTVSEFKMPLPGTAAADREPDFRLSASLDNLDMQRLTAALGWPSFPGVISGEVPGVRLRDGVLDLEGEIRVSVFDGTVSLGNLRVERPFGVLPSLAASLEARYLDLGMLTSTFSFGNISGRLDGYIHDLRMLDWRPVAFDAWFGTPEGQTAANDISRQAVNNLTTLGGGTATAALTGPILRLFSSFSYRRLGLGCRMQNNVCDIRGLREDEDSVLIMEGAGVPKITIRAFNRQVDWPQLVEHLKAATGDNPVRIGD